MATKIVTKNSSTAGSAPLASDLVQGELAVNVTDKRLYTENASGTIVEVGTNPSAEIIANGGIALPDNGKATFGAGDDLQIYHDGSNSYIQDAGTGSLNIKSNGSFIDIQSDSTRINNAANNEIMATFVANGAVTAYYDNAAKLATTSTGIDVTGIVDASDLIRFGVNNSEIANNYVRFKSSGAAYIDHSVVGQNINFRLSNASSLDKTPLVVSPTGIDVTGTATMDGLVISSTSNESFTQTHTDGNTVIFTQSGTGGDVQWRNANGGALINTAATNRALFASNGDVSFFEDTGTTPKLVWSASGESLTIGGELAFRYNGTESLISGGDSLRLRATNEIKIQNFNSTETMAQFIPAGAATLYYANSPKLATTDTGIDVTGEITADALTINSSGIQIGTVLQSTSTVSSRLALMDANTTSGSQVGIGATGNTLGLYAAGGAPKVVVSGTGIDVTGTATMDGLTVSATAPVLKITSADGNNAILDLGNASDPDGGRIVYGAAEALAFYTTSAERMRIDSSGNMGIGTSSPSATLHLKNDFSSGVAVVYDRTENASVNNVFYTGVSSTFNSSFMWMGTAATSFVINNSGNVGIGTSSPSANLHVFKGESGGAAPNSQSSLVLENNSNTYIQFLTPATNESGLLFGDADNDRGGLTYNHASDSMAFRIAAAERMRIDSSGNLLVGKTVNDLTTDGIVLRGSGELFVTRANDVAAFNRRSSNGDIVTFRRDGATVGSIGVEGGDSLYIQSGTDSGAGLHMHPTAGNINPARNGAKVDNAIDLGRSTHRFKDLYLSGGLRGDTLTFGNLAGTVEYARFASSGNFIVGNTTTPSSNNQGAGFINTGASALVQWQSGTTTTSGVSVARFYNPNGNVGSIQLAGTATSYVTSSDQRLKENIADADDAGSKIDAIQVRQYDWKADGSHQDYGMIAQELQAVAPEAVSGDADSEEMMGVDYSKLVPMLIKEIQSLRNRVAQLEG